MEDYLLEDLELDDDFEEEDFTETEDIMARFDDEDFEADEADRWYDIQRCEAMINEEE